MCKNFSFCFSGNRLFFLYGETLSSRRCYVLLHLLMMHRIFISLAHYSVSCLTQRITKDITNHIYLFHNSYLLFLITFTLGMRYFVFYLSSSKKNRRIKAMGEKINHLWKKKGEKNPMRHHSNPKYWQTYGKKTPAKRQRGTKMSGGSR